MPRTDRIVAACAAVLLCGVGLVLARPQSEAPVPEREASTLLARPRTVLLVRHAEKDPAGDPKDPGLSERGRARAAALAALCAEARISHLFASEYERTRATLAPLAKALELELVVVPASKPGELERALDALPEGSVALVAGHSNTIPDLVARLGAEARGLVTTNGVRMLPDDAYDRLFVLTRPPKDARIAPSLVELRYGN